jgi:hypothetical protein
MAIKVKEFATCSDKDCEKEFKKFRTTDKFCSRKCQLKNAKQPTEKKIYTIPKVSKTNKVIEKEKKNYIIPKVSKKRKIENAKYLVLRIEFLSKKENTICPITNQKTTDIHHKKGRTGSLFLDTRYWIALSREGHKYVEENPEWAKENGFSLNRL